MEKRLGEGQETLSHDDAFAWLRDAQEIVERALFPVGEQVKLPGQPGFAVTVLVDGRAMIAATGIEGWLTLLAAGDEGIGRPVAPLTMTGFDPYVDEVVTVFAHPRVLGPRSDLFVAVRRWDLKGRVPALRLYRANAWWEEDEPRLAPGIEDTAGGEGAWPPLDLDDGDVPSWVGAGPLSMVPALSPVKNPPPRDIADHWTAVEPGPARAVAWDGERLVWLSSGPKLVVEQKNSHRTIPLTRAGTALAVGAAGTVPVAVVCGPDWGAQGLLLDDGEPEKIRPWLQRLPCHPVAVALLPQESGWPDVVVAARDGRLHRFRYVRPERTFECRLRLLERMRRDLKLERLDDWVDWIRPRISEIDDRQARARIGRLLVRLVDLTPSVISKPTGAEVHKLARLLAGEPTSGTEVDVGKALGEALLSSTAGEEEIRCLWPDTETGPYTDLVRNALANWAYEEGSFALREQVDIALGDCTRPPLGPALADLLQYHPRNRWEEWATLEGEKRGAFPRLGLLVDFTVERYLLERQDSAKGRWDRLTTCVSSGDLLAVGAGRDGLRIVRFQPSAEGLAHPSTILDTSVEPPGLFPACIVQISDAPPLFVLGEHAARARFFDLDGEVKLVHGQSGSSCAAIAVVPGSTSPAVWCLLGWNEGRRSFLEIWEARPGKGGWTGGRVAYGPLGLRNVGGLGVLGPAREGTVELVAGDALTGELARITARRRADAEDFDTTESWRVPLDGGVTTVHVDRERGQVLAGTAAGTTWAVDVDCGSVRWTFRSRHPIHSIRAEDSSGEAGYVILAPPDDLVVISNERVPVWHRRHGGPFADLAVASLSGDLRLLVGTGDRLHVFRRPAPDRDWSTRTVEERGKLGSGEPKRFRHIEAVEVAAALEGGTQGDLLRRFSETRSRRARMEIIKRLAKPEAGPKERADVLDRLSWREICALLHALPSGAGAWERDVVDKVTSARSWGAGDRSRSAWSVAVVEVVRRVAASAENVAEVGALLHRLPADLAADRAWLALEAAQAWLAAVAREAGMRVCEVPADMVLEHLHQLPHGLASELPLLVRTPGRARGLQRLGRWALTEGNDATELREVADDLEKEGDTPLVKALAGALRLAATSEPEWDEVCGLIGLVRDFRAPELWAALVRPALLPADLGPPPGEEAPLAEQVDWLDRAVARRPAEAFDSGRSSSWSAVAHRVINLLDERLRWAYRRRLDHVENVGRLRPEVTGSNRPVSQRLDVALRLIPEGRRPVGDARVSVRCPDLASFDEGKKVEWSLYRRELRDGEAPELLDLRARCDAAAEIFRVEVAVRGAGGYHNEYAWDFPMPSAGDAGDDGGIAPFPKAVPTACAAAVQAVNQLRTGMAVVSADAAIRPSQLVQDVGTDAQSR
ncbi:MAG: hypothetical protein GY856_51775, partial [bacterium]|nr:hypothetical protein [bacterium]